MKRVREPVWWQQSVKLQSSPCHLLLRHGSFSTRLVQNFDYFGRKDRRPLQFACFSYTLVQHFASYFACALVLQNPLFSSPSWVEIPMHEYTQIDTLLYTNSKCCHENKWNKWTGFTWNKYCEEYNLLSLAGILLIFPFFTSIFILRQFNIAHSLILLHVKCPWNISFFKSKDDFLKINVFEIIQRNYSKFSKVENTGLYFICQLK